MTERIVVIGGDAAGMSAASQAKRIAGDAVQIVAFERGAYTSYSACGIPYWVAGDVKGPERLVARSPEAHRRNGIPPDANRGGGDRPGGRVGGCS
jgi:NADPH-dependent 2,4-dienoyl-CoA reductase/sulfur reductase-like enzyme